MIFSSKWSLPHDAPICTKWLLTSRMPLKEYRQSTKTCNSIHSSVFLNTTIHSVSRKKRSQYFGNVTNRVIGVKMETTLNVPCIVTSPISTITLTGILRQAQFAYVAYFQAYWRTMQSKYCLQREVLLSRLCSGATMAGKSTQRIQCFWKRFPQYSIDPYLSFKGHLYSRYLNI